MSALPPALPLGLPLKPQLLAFSLLLSPLPCSSPHTPSGQVDSHSDALLHSHGLSLEASEDSSWEGLPAPALSWVLPGRFDHLHPCTALVTLKGNGFCAWGSLSALHSG